MKISNSTKTTHKKYHSFVKITDEQWIIKKISKDFKECFPNFPKSQILGKFFTFPKFWGSKSCVKISPFLVHSKKLFEIQPS